MGNCHSNGKRLTDEELGALHGKFLIENGYDIDDSYVCSGYLRRYCNQLEVRPVAKDSEFSGLVNSIKQIYPVILHVSINGNGMILGASYN